MFSLNLSNLKEILFLLCVFVVGWEFVVYREVRFQSITDRAALQTRIDSIDMETIRVQYLRDMQTEKWQKVYAELQKMQKEDNATNTDNSIDAELISNKRDKLITEIERSDSLNEIYKFIWRTDSLFTVYLTSQNQVINTKEQESYKEYRRLLIPISFIVIVLLPGILYDEYLKRVQSSVDLYRSGKPWLHCQSCGKNFSPVRHQSTNLDGTKNNDFCAVCFSNGAFTNAYSKRQEVEAEIVQHYRNNKAGFRRRVKKYVESLQRWAVEKYTEIDRTDFFSEPSLNETWIDDVLDRIGRSLK